MDFTLANLEKDYELELDRVVKEIQNSGAKSVLLQLPDGLKPWGPAVADYLSDATCVGVRIYLGDCFGACDLPSTDCDLVIQFGHAAWD